MCTGVSQYEDSYEGTWKLVGRGQVEKVPCSLIPTAGHCGKGNETVKPPMLPGFGGGMNRGSTEDV